MAMMHIPYDPRSDPSQYISQGLSQMLSGLGQGMAALQKKRILGQDVQALMNWKPGMPMPALGSTELQQAVGMGAASNMMNAQMPITPYQTKELAIRQQMADAAKTRASVAGKGTERLFPVKWYDPSGKLKSTLVPASQYQMFMDNIEKYGGKLEEPEKWEDKYQYWQARYRSAAPEVDVLGQIVPGTGDTTAAQVAQRELRKLEQDKFGKTVLQDSRNTSSNQPGFTTPPKISLSAPVQTPKPTTGLEARDMYIRKLPPGVADPRKMNIMKSGLQGVPAKFWNDIGPDKTTETMEKLANGATLIIENGSYVLVE